MRVHKMTKWDAGQDLIACADLLGEKEEDLREAGFRDLADILRACRLKIGTEFNRLGSYSFGLPEEKETK